jgi:succinate dehydrogenase/fumarate reductase flavoprotein subunit
LSHGEAHDVDVVVVGSGSAAMSAALRSTLGGASVTVLEVAPQFGGTSAMSGGGMWIPRTHMAKAAGVDDPRESVKEYLNHLTKGIIEESVVDAFIDAAPAAIAYIEDNTALRFYVDLERPDYYPFAGTTNLGRLIGPQLYDLNRLGDLLPLLRQPDWLAPAGSFGKDGRSGMQAITQPELLEFEKSDDPMGWVELSRERAEKGTVPRGCALIGAMLEVVAKNGAHLLNNARARKLVIDDDGRVTGVVAEIDGGKETFNAAKGVVIASGGFEHNDTLWDGLVRTPGRLPLSPPFNRGDSLLLEQQAGARLALVDQATWAMTQGSQPGQIAVNRAGRRFINECLAYNDQGKIYGFFDPHTYDFPNVPAWVISNKPFTPGEADPNRIGLEPGASVTAPSLRELAGLIGVDADGLEATVAEFDVHAAEGRDPQFGRGEAAWDSWRKFDTSLPNPALGPLGTEGPFYATVVIPRVFGTRGGAMIDKHARILDFDNKPIPGLHGAGAAICSPFGNAYPGGGGTIGPAVTFGYLAGEYLTGND